MRLRPLLVILLLALCFSCSKSKSEISHNNVLSENVSDTFFCIDGPLRIRKEPDIRSAQIGLLNLFDMADVIEKTKIRSTIDGINDFWYKVSFQNIDGFVFGGYGVILSGRNEVKTIDDFILAFPSEFHVEELGRYVFTYNANDGIPMVRLNYGINFLDHVSNMYIYFRPTSQIDVDYISKKYNLKIDTANNTFGMGSSYKQLTDTSVSTEFITRYGNNGRYFFSHWVSGWSYDIASFLFETEFDDIFDGILISPFNLWLNYQNNENIIKINNNFIKESKTSMEKESIMYQILYEVIMRIEIVD